MLHLRPRYLVYVLLLTLFPLGGLRAQEARPPLIWLTLHSYQRLEQRMRELATQAKAPALADLFLSVLQLRFGGLQGLDRQRPISMFLPTLDDSEEPPVVLALPYSNQKDVFAGLGTLFPTITPQGNILQLQGESGEVFGHFDEPGKVLFLALSANLLDGATLPPVAFTTTAGEEADLVMRVDVGAMKRRHPDAWKAWLEKIEAGWRESWKKLEEDTKEQVDKAFLAAYFAMSQKQTQQLLADLSAGDVRIRLAPERWVLEFAIQMTPGSTTGGFATSQTQLTPRAGRLFSNAAAARFLYSLQVTESMRSDLLPVLALGRQAAEAKLTADTTLTPAQRTAGMTGIAQGMRAFEHWIAQLQLDMAGEAQPAGGNNMSMTAWFPVSQSQDTLHTFLDMIGNVLQLSGPTKGSLTRNATEHRGTAVHRLNFTFESQGGAPPDPLFFASQQDTIAVHFGPSPEPLTQLLDRMQAVPATPTAPSNIIGFLEIFVAPWLQAAASKAAAEPEGSPALVAAAVQFQDVREPLRIEAIALPNTFAGRYLIPGVLIERGAAMLGQQALQGMQKSLGGQ